MRPMTKRSGIARSARLALAGAALFAVSGCKNLLDVANPNTLDAGKIGNPVYLDLLANGVQGEYDQMLTWTSIYAAKLSDEVTNHHVYYEEQDIDRRDIGDPTTNGTYGLAVYAPLHRVRFLADSVAALYKKLEGGDTAGRDLRLARVQAVAGYSYVLLGELLCGTPINVSKLYTSDEVLGMAPTRFDDAIKVAKAAKAWATSGTSGMTAAAAAQYAAGADSVLALAQVGAARAYLDLNNKAKALEYAQAVTPAWTSDASPGFQYWSWFLENSSNNRWWQVAAYSAGGGNREVGLDATPFNGLVDPRVPQQKITVMDGTGGTTGTSPGVMVPKASQFFNVYNGTVAGAEITKGSALRMASAIEARYIVAEAQGKNTANLAFLNNRRALGGMTAVDAAISDTDYVKALIEQRARDLFLDGHRVGDMRRYKKYYSLDFWPHGQYLTTTFQYGNQECFPLPLSETQSNPNLK